MSIVQTWAVAPAGALGGVAEVVAELDPEVWVVSSPSSEPQPANNTDPARPSAASFLIFTWSLFSVGGEPPSPHGKNAHHL